MSTCQTCDFRLWNPYAKLSVSELGLYSDERFPGRSILKLEEHWDRLEEMPEELSFSLIRDVRLASEVLRHELGAERVNVAILGNSVTHVHVHLIPRYPHREERPGSSPWDDPRERLPLEQNVEDFMMERLRLAFLER